MTDPTQEDFEISVVEPNANADSPAFKIQTTEEAAVEYEPSDVVTLPVGITKDGQRYRTVHIEEMCGIDEHLMSSSKARENGAVATTMILGRCIQEIEGVLPQKKNPEAQFDRSVGRALTQVDRDFLITRIQLLGGSNEIVMAGVCPRCDQKHEEPVLMSDLPVQSWPTDDPLHVEFELIKGIKLENGKFSKKGKIRFPLGKDQELAAKADTGVAQMDLLLSACIFDMEEIGKLDTETVKRLKSSDRRELFELLRTQLPGVRQWKEKTCDCGKVMTMAVDLTSFFDSRRKRQKS